MNEKDIDATIKAAIDEGIPPEERQRLQVKQSVERLEIDNKALALLDRYDLVAGSTVKQTETGYFIRASDHLSAIRKLQEEQKRLETDDEPSPAMIAAGWACLKRAHLPHLGPGPGLIDAYKAMRAQLKKEKGIT